MSSGVLFKGSKEEGIRTLLDCCIKYFSLERQVEGKKIEEVKEICPSQLINVISLWNKEDVFYKRDSCIIIKKASLVNNPMAFFFKDFTFFSDICNSSTKLEYFLFEKTKEVLLDKRNYDKNFIPFVSQDFSIVTVCSPEQLSKFF